MFDIFLGILVLECPNVSHCGLIHILHSPYDKVVIVIGGDSMGVVYEHTKSMYQVALALDDASYYIAFIVS